MQTFILRRLANTACSTRGELFAPDSVTKLAEALERGLLNPNGHPRIPAGEYPIIFMLPSRFDALLTGKLHDAYHGILRLQNVPGRTAIEIHPANWIDELLGCIALGESWHTDAHGDFCVWDSDNQYCKVYPLIAAAILKEGAHLRIEDESP